MKRLFEQQRSQVSSADAPQTRWRRRARQKSLWRQLARMFLPRPIRPDLVASDLSAPGADMDRSTGYSPFAVSDAAATQINALEWPDMAAVLAFVLPLKDRSYIQIRNSPFVMQLTAAEQAFSVKFIRMAANVGGKRVALHLSDYPDQRRCRLESVMVTDCGDDSDGDDGGGMAPFPADSDPTAAILVGKCFGEYGRIVASCLFDLTRGRISIDDYIRRCQAEGIREANMILMLTRSILLSSMTLETHTLVTSSLLIYQKPRATSEVERALQTSQLAQTTYLQERLRLQALLRPDRSQRWEQLFAERRGFYLSLLSELFVARAHGRADPSSAERVGKLLVATGFPKERSGKALDIACQSNPYRLPVLDAYIQECIGRELPASFSSISDNRPPTSIQLPTLFQS